MPRGGFRPGAGRPKKTKDPAITSSVPSAPAVDFSLAPLDYLLQLMRDPTADLRRRDWAAATAAAYLHRRGGDAQALPPRARARQAALERDRAEREAWDERAKVIRAKFGR